MSMQVLQGGKDPLDFMTSSGTSTEKDLLKVRYTRVQQESPDFTTMYEGIDQGVDIKVTTFNFRVAPEPLVAMYDFIMTTFVPEKNDAAPPSPDADVSSPDLQTQGTSQDKIRVTVKLAGVQSLCFHSLSHGRN